MILTNMIKNTLKYSQIFRLRIKVHKIIINFIKLICKAILNQRKKINLFNKLVKKIIFLNQVKITVLNKNNNLIVELIMIKIQITIFI